MKAGLGDHGLEFAEGEDKSVLALVHGVDAHAEQAGRHEDGDQKRGEFLHGCRPLAAVAEHALIFVAGSGGRSRRLGGARRLDGALGGRDAVVGERGGVLLGLSHGVGLRVVDDLVERQVQQVVAALGVDVDLGDVLHDVAHGVDVESVARDFRSPGVLGLQGGEAVGIASGGLDDAGLIAERLFLR